jgi:hypothetical protein
LPLCAFPRNTEGLVSKIEFLEYLREHKPKDEPYNSVAKLQTMFGFNSNTSIKKDKFVAAFEGLNPKLTPAMFSFYTDPRQIKRNDSGGFDFKK